MAAANRHRCCCLCCCCTAQDENTEEMTVLGENHEEHHLPRKDYESLDYDVCHNEICAQMLESRDKKSVKSLEAMKWVTTFLIGVFTGLIAFFIDFFVKLLSKWKFDTVGISIESCSLHGCLVISLLILLAFNVGFVLISSCLVALEPIAAGSGIPEIKCYLNGVKVPHVVRLKTLLSKATGVLFSVAGGLFVGKEGPMIHSGAIIGAGIPQFKSITFKRCKCNFPYFRTDRDKRDFVSGGAAAGVAAAFGAPIGGVLFSLEEGSSFWNQSLTWRTFFCSMSATLTLNFFLSGAEYKQWGALDQPGLIDFGVFKCGNEGECNLWTVVDLLIFIVMGVVGGLLGALFNSLNTTLTKHRLKYITTRNRGVRILEAMFVAMVTTTLAFVAAMTLGQCKEITNGSMQSNVTNGTNLTDDSVDSSLRSYFCKDGYYNDMATLFFNSQESAIKQLFHQEGAFSLPTLGIFFMLFYILACWTYGILVPSGLFVPCLLCGAAYGRFVGNVLQSFLGYNRIYSGTFALIGAAAFLGGVVRMTISLTVILIESTNEISYGFPIMVTLMVAKWTGDLFNEGIYDIHIELKGVPLLGWEAPQNMHSLRAHEVMDTNLVYVYPHTRVQSVVSILRTTRHNAYPVVTETVDKSLERSVRSNTLASQNIQFKKESTLTRAAEVRRRTLSQSSVEMRRRTSSGASRSGARRVVGDDEDIDKLLVAGRPEPYKAYYPEDNRPLEEEYKPLTFHGLVLRSQLVTMLEKGVCYPEGTPSTYQPHLSYEDLTEDYPRFKDIYDLDLTQLNPRMIMDVTSYMNPCPYMVSPDMPVSQVYNLFRTMGLRHLLVINSVGEILGMITRHNLTDHYLKERLRFHRHANS